MKKIYLTAEYTSSATVEVEVPNDFNPNGCDLDDLYFSKVDFQDLKPQIIGNLEMNEVWLVRDENDQEIYVK